MAVVSSSSQASPIYTMPDFSPDHSPVVRTSSIDLDGSSSRRSLVGRGNTLNLEAGTFALDAPPPRPQSPQKNTQISVFSLLKTKILAFYQALPSFRALLKPAEELGPTPGVKQSLRAVLLSSFLNVFLICIPACWLLHWLAPQQYAAIFFTGFIAILPLAKLLAFATDELSLRVGQALAGLINATLGNSVELIVAIVALTKCELEIVQSSLIGSVLSNLLLVLGMCFFLGGIKFSEQGFAAGAAQLSSSLLTLSVVAVLLPAAYRMSLKENSINHSAESSQTQILKFSHGIALILLFMYGCYLLFQLCSHAAMYQDDSADIVKSTTYNHEQKSPITPSTKAPNHESVMNQDIIASETSEPEEADNSEHPQLNGWVCTGLLLVVTALVALTAEFLVGSINGLTASGALTKEFVGIILLPIVGNAAEHVTAVTVARKDKLTLSMGVAVGSSIQIALFVIPLTVVVGWMIGKPMTLFFDPYEAVCLFLAVLTVNYVVQDGKSNWLEGMILMCLYAILATLFFFYPGMSSADHFAVCT
ncbi:Calcium/proton exchanger [Favolaschia claudopus]|uniref:Calcium/proton exchanger n=1 Tax=Favolaschia claudopus TaxID=2862362 RepID=A0AAW0D1W4_9AGAR